MVGAGQSIIPMARARREDRKEPRRWDAIDARGRGSRQHEAAALQSGPGQQNLCDHQRSVIEERPLLASPALLATGARPNELAQLQTDDLDKKFNKRPHLSVLCLLDDDDQAAEPAAKAQAKEDPRRVKTAAGRRMIPLHPILIKAGIIQFIEGRHNGRAKQLFRELHADKGASC
jgi:integrase